MRKVEVFTARCPLCDDAVKMVKSIACSSCDVQVLDLNTPENAQRAVELGVRSVPAVAVDGELAACCRDGGITEEGLRATGIGTPTES